ncbi:MAG TPA: exosortase/archaeosortase family protein [Gemmatimonadales bacterium]|nr:exosortase/archaeosortase family protein [Gemmatimonadales bacterium]
MTSVPASAAERATVAPSRIQPALVLTAVCFAILFAKPAVLLVKDWWTNPEAGHGLLLAPVAIWLAWKKGLLPSFRPAPILGLALLVLAILLRGVADLAAELFSMRASLVLAAVALIIYFRGVRQATAWWLPIALLALSIPLPELITSALALPLQFKASALGTKLLEWRGVPVLLSGNVIHLPGHQLFVTEACSGLRSLSALLSLAVLMGGLWFRHPLTRVLLIVVAIPVAILLNGVRVFLTGFLVYFVDPKLGEGFMHLTEGWLLFLVSLSLIGMTALLFRFFERRMLPSGAPAATNVA